MTKVNYYNIDSIHKKLSCEISKAYSNDNIIVKATMIDDMDQKWASTIKPVFNNGVFRFTIDDINKKITFNGFNKFNLGLKLYNFLKKMSYPREHYVQSFMKLSDKPITLDIEIYLNNRSIDKRVFTIPTRNSHILKKRISSTFKGVYYHLPNQNRPTILVISGSMGDYNWSETVASILSNYGYNTLSLAYFSYKRNDNLPSTLTNINLEYFLEAVNWIKREYPKSQIGIIGLSKGAEAALLLESNYPGTFQSIIAISPSSYSFEGVYLGKAKNKGSWSMNSTPIPFLKYDKNTKLTMLMPPGYLLNVHNLSIFNSTKDQLEKARIKSENIKASCLLISGAKDLTWPSIDMAEELHNWNSKIVKITYMNIGHIFTGPNIPITVESKTQSLIDGYVENNDAWSEIIKHFNKTLII